MKEEIFRSKGGGSGPYNRAVRKDRPQEVALPRLSTKAHFWIMYSPAYAKPKGFGGQAVSELWWGGMFFI